MCVMVVGIGYRLRTPFCSMLYEPPNPVLPAFRGKSKRNEKAGRELIKIQTGHKLRGYLFIYLYYIEP